MERKTCKNESKPAVDTNASANASVLNAEVKTNVKANTLADATANTTPDTSTNAVADTSLDIVPDVVANASAVTDAVPDAAANVVADANAVTDAVTSASPDVAPNAVADGVANANAVTNAITNASPDVVSDAGPEATADVVAHAVTDAVTNAIPDFVPDAAPDAAADVVTNAVADVVTNANAAADAVANASPDIVPDAASDAATNAITNAVADSSTNLAPDAVPNALPDASTDASSNARHFVDMFEGGGNATADTPNDKNSMLVMTVNVTSLNKSRLLDVLGQANDAEADVVLLQETKHRTKTYPWATATAKNAGFKFHLGPPLTDTNHGGVAIMWRHTVQKVHLDTHPRLGHRCLTIQWPSFRLVNFYGAYKGDTNALVDLLQWATRDHRSAAIIGDFNWKKVYGQHIVDWEMCDPQPTTTKTTAPTRCLTYGLEANFMQSVSLPSIPLHQGVFYDLAIPTPEPLPLTRLTKTAMYQWTCDEQDVIIDQRHPITAAVDKECPAPPPGATFLKRWKAFNERAELTFVKAAEQGLAEVTSRGERKKAAAAEPTAFRRSAPHRPDETIRMRRLKRLHRRLSTNTQMNHGLTRKHQAALTHALDIMSLGHDVEVVTYGQAIEAITTGINQEHTHMAKGDAMLWRARLQHPQQVWKASKHILSEPTEEPKVTFEEAANTLTNIWCPTSAETMNERRDANKANWTQLALEAGLHPRTTSETPTIDDCRTHFQQAIKKARGAHGLDGWSADELQAIANVMPIILEELLTLLYDLTFGRHNDKDEGFLETLAQMYSLRVACLAKKDTIRPIAVASTLVRAWHKVLLKTVFPRPSDVRQFGHRGTTIATAQWLNATLVAGGELDLSGAFDNICHGAAGAALGYNGVPSTVVKLLAIAWRAPRLITMSGHYVSTLLPNKGIPQGLPDSPAVCAETTAPGNTLVRRQRCTTNWAYVDDRTIGITPPTDGLPAPTPDSLADFAAAVDQRVDLLENRSKRQVWTADDPASATVEHLGLYVNHPTPTQPIRPTKSWDKATVVAKRLRNVPGSQKTRTTLATAYIQPMINWAAPLAAIHPNADELACQIFRSCLSTQCTWWCRGRWWLMHVHLHPKFGAAIATFKALPRVVEWPSPHMENSVKLHAASVDLNLQRLTPTGPVVTPTSDAHPQLKEAFRKYTRATSARAPSSATVDNDHAQHLIRTAARLKCLSLIQTSRKDAEGYANIDVEASSAPTVARWMRKLSPADAAWLQVYRCGANYTPTRVFNKYGSSACWFCHEEYASMRHFVVDCRHFATQRHTLLRDHTLPPDTLGRLPRVSVKSGWVTTDASPSEETRHRIQLVLLQLGLHITRELSHYINTSYW